jgi:hypothetical protein
MSSSISVPPSSSFGTFLEQRLPATLEKVVQKNLATGEEVFIRLKGAFKEALICTDQRVMIIKSGFMTGQMFGSDVFQLPYRGIASAEVKYRILSGYFQISAGGMQNTAKSYWSSERSTNPSKAPNCVSLNSRLQATNFRSACAFIMEHIEQTRRVPSPSESDVAASLGQLWKLRTEGAISQSEYEAAKERLLASSFARTSRR